MQRRTQSQKSDTDEHHKTTFHRLPFPLLQETLLEHEEPHAPCHLSFPAL